MASSTTSLVAIPTAPGQALLDLIIVLLVLTWVTVIARTLTRYKINALGLDDWLMLVGLVFFTITCSLVILSVYHGAGAHAAQLTAYDNMTGSMWFVHAQLIYCVTTIPIKCSICVSLRRVATKPGYKHALHAITGLTVGSCIIFETVIPTYCRPFAASWGGGAPTTKHQHRLLLPGRVHPDGLGAGGAVLPAFVLHDVRLKRRVKVSVCVILAMGGFASTATIVRRRYLVLYNDPVEFLYGVAPVAVWSLVEEGVGVVAGSLAALRPLFGYIPFLRSSSSSRAGGGSSTTGGGVGGGGFKSRFSGRSRGAHRKGSVKMQNITGCSSTVAGAYDPGHLIGRDAYGDGDCQKNVLKETDVMVVVTTDLEAGQQGKDAGFGSGRQFC
ncbi:hypothetical protein SLS58_010191 [Diplodia intermedia]|uniref:Rhodopsin domain-containing protein n=1 Tax=Diplodia intermedia TaxID=856260 RepID=A0ABR3T7H4_9PEZI